MGTIHSVDRMWSAETSDAKVSNNSRTLNVSFTDQYQIFCTPDTTILEVYDAPGIPPVLSSYPGLPTVYCQRGTPKRISPVYWQLPIYYQGEVSISAPGVISSALDAKPLVQSGVRTTEMEVDEDYDGAAILTANFEPVKVRRIFKERTITVTRNMPFFSDFAMSIYDDAVNSDSFLGWPPGTGTVELFAENVFDKDFGYWKVRGVFNFRRPYRTTPDKAWYARWRHEGFYERIDNVGPGAGFRIVRAVDGNKEPNAKPVLLDENGYRITNGNAYWKETKLYNPLPFSNIGLS